MEVLDRRHFSASDATQYIHVIGFENVSNKKTEVLLPNGICVPCLLETPA